MTAKVETVEELLRTAFQKSKNPARIALARQTIHAITEAREGDIFGLWREITKITKIEENSPDLLYWKDVIHAVASMAYLTRRRTLEETQKKAGQPDTGVISPP